MRRRWIHGTYKNVTRSDLGGPRCFSAVSEGGLVDRRYAISLTRTVSLAK